MYKIFMIRYWTKLPITNLLTLGECITFEGEPEYVTNTLEEAVGILKNKYIDKLYKAPWRNGIKCSLTYILDDSDRIKAVLDFDGNVLIA